MRNMIKPFKEFLRLKKCLKWITFVKTSKTNLFEPFKKLLTLKEIPI